MDKALESKLILCLDALEQGESIERILSRYPNEAEQLRPLLKTAVQLDEFKLNPSLAAQNRSKEAFLAQADALRNASRSPRTSLFRLPRLVMPLVALVVLLLFGAGLVSVSATATPGEPFYGTKRFVEDFQLNLTTDPVLRTDLIAQFNQERIREIRLLLDDGHSTDVEFEGAVDSIEPEVWIIAGLETRVNDETRFEGVPRIGNLVSVSGRTHAGELIAELITLLPDGQPPSTATPTHTPTATPAVAPSSTPTPAAEVDVPQSPSSTSTETPEATDTPAPAVPATVTATDTPLPTATSTISPVPDASSAPTSNDNGEDHNDNEDDDHANENENDSSNENENENGSSNENENDNGSSNENENENHNDND